MGIDYEKEPSLVQHCACITCSLQVRMMNEILNCIKLIKMYAWEKSFAKAISGMSYRACIKCC